MNKNSGLIGLKIIRKRRNLNQQKVAMDLNISREVISYYENGKRNPDIQMLKTLSKYFGVSIDFLINGEDYKK
ncbi:MAG: helix-turn-helix transcriptional regulator [Clostridia bacterium]|nr:helix-turn-helix transcriptional regulator [Clostridia bacterium]